MTFKQACREAYLDYKNNFLTVEKFAEHYDMDIDFALSVIENGRELHEQYVDNLKVQDAPSKG